MAENLDLLFLYLHFTQLLESIIYILQQIRFLIPFTPIPTCLLLTHPIWPLGQRLLMLFSFKHAGFRPQVSNNEHATSI